MSDKSTMEKQLRGEATDSAIELVIAAERQRCIDRVLTYATLRDQAAVNLDKAADGAGPEKPSEGAAERARMQAEVAALTKKRAGTRNRVDAASICRTGACGSPAAGISSSVSSQTPAANRTGRNG